MPAKKVSDTPAEVKKTTSSRARKTKVENDVTLLTCEDESSSQIVQANATIYAQDSPSESKGPVKKNARTKKPTPVAPVAIDITMNSGCEAESVPGFSLTCEDESSTATATATATACGGAVNVGSLGDLVRAGLAPPLAEPKVPVAEPKVPVAEPKVPKTPVSGKNGSISAHKTVDNSNAQADDLDSKKKGRKPRGGKIVAKPAVTPIAQPYLTNVVLNLKCSMQDLKDYTAKLNHMIINPLEYNSAAPPEVKYYDGTQPFSVLETCSRIYSSDNSAKHAEPNHWRQNMTGFGNENNASESDIDAAIGADSDRRAFRTGAVSAGSTFGENVAAQSAAQSNVSYLCSNCSCVGQAAEFALNESSQNLVHKMGTDVDLDEKDDVNMKDMMAKLKQLKVQLYKNSIRAEKKSACFWCTYDFDNTPCYIPKYEMDGTIYGYGSFCRPECAVAYLMKESIDDSTKFDRYQLLNQIYSKVYECKKNIKPAPNPHYLLDKFYGSLSIQEYRKLLKTEHLLLVIDKPLTRILPELHEDTDEAFTKLYGIKSATSNASGVYKVKRQSEQPNGPSKASIIRNAFGLPS